MPNELHNFPFHSQRRKYFLEFAARHGIKDLGTNSNRADCSQAGKKIGCPYEGSNFSDGRTQISSYSDKVEFSNSTKLGCLHFFDGLILYDKLLTPLTTP